MTDNTQRFGFGKNWEDFIQKQFSEERVKISQKHILSFLKLIDLKGKYFLDIGCGSGLSSLAAIRSGADKVVSFDYDKNAVSTTKMLQEYSGNPVNWEVKTGSILDKQFIGTIEPADIIYAWGVLHHTGNMWQAMDNTARLAKKDGLLYIALYDYDIQVNPTPEYWLKVKQRYNRSNQWGKCILEVSYILRHFPTLLKRTVFGWKQRGMAFYTDTKDWLGGWPMEFAKRTDVKTWAKKTGLEILTMKTGEANTEYLFKIKDSCKGEHG